MHPNVPQATVRDTTLSFIEYNFARPKSETFGVKSSSKRILCGLISKYRICMSHP